MLKTESISVGELTISMHTDKEILDWLNEQTVDVLYLDDGRVIDVRGNDIRAALAAYMSGDKPKKPQTVRIELIGGLNVVSHITGWLGSLATLTIDQKFELALPGERIWLDLPVGEILWYGHRSSMRDDMNAGWAVVQQDGTLQRATVGEAYLWFRKQKQGN